MDVESYMSKGLLDKTTFTLAWEKRDTSFYGDAVLLSHLGIQMKWKLDKYGHFRYRFIA